MGRVDVDAALDGLEGDVWALVDARARSRDRDGANGAVAAVCAVVLLVSSAIGVSTAASNVVEPGPFALDQPYAPATALGR